MLFLLIFVFVTPISSILFSMNQHKILRNGFSENNIFPLPESTDQYYFEILKREMREEVTQFLLDNFGKEEPLSKAAKIKSEEILESLNMGLDRAFQSNISIIARSWKTNQIIGCKINSVWKRNDVEENNENEKDFEFKTIREEVQMLGEILNELHGQFWKTQPDIHTVIHAEIVSVNKTYWRQGIASKFMDFTESQQVLKSVKASGIVAEVTSFANQKLLEKRNYTTLYTIPLAAKVNENGKQVLICDDGTIEVKLMFKK